MEMLIAARAVAGLGGGGMQTLSQITIGDIFTPQERGRWMGLIMSAFGLAAIIGPTLGGWITDGIGWRWVFWLNIPFGVVPLAALLYALPTVRHPAKVVIDYLGSAALVLGLVPILLAVTWLGGNYTWSDPRVFGGIIVGVLFLALFVWQELRAEEPIVSPAFFKNGIFVVSMTASFCLALGMFGAILFVPLFVQGVIGDSAQNSGVVLTPMMIGFIVGSFISGQLVSRWGRYRIQAIVGLAVGAFGMFLFGVMGVHTSNAIVVRNMTVLGLGIGSVMPLFTIAVQNAFPYQVLGAVTAARQFFMALGGAIGVPVMGALLNNGFRDQFVKHLSLPLIALMKRQGTSAVDPNTLISSEAQAAIRAKFLHLGSSGPQLYHQFIFAVRDGLALTMQTLFHVGLFFLLAALVTCFFLKEIPLRRNIREPQFAVADEVTSMVVAPEPISALPEEAGGS
jgi:EmrB/QacA subfamily drug resistance transporter